MQIIVNILIGASLYFILAASFWMIFRTIKIFHLAHGSVFTIGAYAAISATRIYVRPIPTLPMWFIALLAAAAVGCAAGLTIDTLVYRPLRRSRAPSVVFLLASFGTLVFLDNLTAILFGTDPKFISHLLIQRGMGLWGGAVVTLTQVMLCVCSLAVLVAGVLIARTQLIWAAQAVSLDPLGASSVGIDPARVIRWVIAAGSALGGMGGMLAALEINVRPTIGFQLLFKAIVASVIGGRKLTGVFLSSLLLSALEQTTDRLLSGSWRDGVAFLLLIVFLLVRKEGIARSFEEVRPD